MGKQTRSENTYQKINTVFNRDENNIIMQYDLLCTPELEYLRDMPMYATEKIDGTNIRIEAFPTPEWDTDVDESTEPLLPPLKGVTYEVEYKGKTDNAQLPPKLMKLLETKYPKDAVLTALGIKPYVSVDEFEERKWLGKGAPKYTIYGEGYGVGIQKGGRYIRDHCDFILFDVKVGDLYLLSDNAKDIATKLGCEYVPELGIMSINQAIELCRKGFTSKIAEDPTLIAEGIVLKTPVGLCSRMGKRIIAKVKCCDFQKYRQRYGTDDPVPQTKNPKYQDSDE